MENYSFTYLNATTNLVFSDKQGHVGWIDGVDRKTQAPLPLNNRNSGLRFRPRVDWIDKREVLMAYRHQFRSTW